MSSLPRTLPRVLLSAAFLALTATVSAATFKAAKDKSPFNMDLPAYLLGQGITVGTATLLVDINADGNVSDAIAISGTDKRFAEMVEQAFMKRTFKPAMIDDTPVPMRVTRSIRIRQEGAPAYRMGSGEFNLRHASRFDGEVEESFQVPNLAELENPPRAIQTVMPVPPDHLKEETKVIVDFIVDEEGNVRVPWVEGNFSPATAYRAMEAVRRWKFEPAQKNGHSVAVRVKVPLLFPAQAAKSSEDT